MSNDNFTVIAERAAWTFMWVSVATCIYQVARHIIYW
jgi:hypothetical protein